MKIKNIELANISRYRGELMGIAMIFIFLFHVALPRSNMFFGLRRIGNIGVDMFLFLSGIGLWFSWIKHPSLKRFFKRRYLRIYPAWLIISCLYYIPHFHGGSLHAWIDLVGDITINWDFWLHNELTFWYIPAMMMLYLFAPPYMELIRRHPVYRWLPVVMISWCILVQYVTPIHNAVGHIEIFWSRVPIFFIGINMGDAVRRKDKMDGASIWMILIVFVMTLSASIFLEQNLHNRFPLYVERMLYIPLTISTILLLNRVFRRTPKWFNSIFKFVGALSLECYLIHIHFVLDYIPNTYGYWTTFIICILITMPLSWVLSKIVNYISNFIEKYIWTSKHI
ncbi:MULTISPECIES: acyltransferase family protein [Prevotella]|uniref:Acyltransferase n=1 Tax=Prevotella herbatica TaxID=2801997 RepID=A0ABN6EIK1_9BACT|nr:MULTISPECIES: acyltransferase [Prevotella]MDN5554475.1 acyltransferase [Prevotella sp.]BCS84919.1 acyltransferase [Prevotella herbatica]